jgi:hypothetical protein
LYKQIGALLDGREPEDMNPVNNPAFLLEAAATGGGFGLFGDFVKATENRFGQTPLEALAGPGLSMIGDALMLTFGNVLEKAGGAEDAKAGRELRRYLQRYTPIVSSHWATRGAYNRIVLDNLQWMIDPEADRSFKAQARQAEKDGRRYFVPPGSLTPLRN